MVVKEKTITCPYCNKETLAPMHYCGDLYCKHCGKLIAKSNPFEWNDPKD